MRDGTSLPPQAGKRGAWRATGDMAAWILLVVAVVAMVTGLAQSGWIAWRLLVRGELVWRSRDFAWMMPASYLLPLLGVALVAAPLGAVLRHRWISLDARRAAAGAVLFTGTLALVLLLPGLHAAARVLVAMGMAAQAAPWLARMPALRLGRVAVALVALIVLIGGGERVIRALRAARAVAALPPAPAAPNVLLLILDTVRAQSLSLYGYARETTPALARWAREGTTFDHAIATAPWTLPSHASIFTGRQPSELPVGEREPLGKRYPTVAEAFAARGYLTGGFVANVYYAGYDSGLGRGFIHYDDHRVTWQQVLWSSTLAQTELAKGLLWQQGVRAKLRVLRAFDLRIYPLRFAHRKSAEVVANDFLEWERARGDRPYFAFLNFFDAHAAYLPPARHRQRFARNPGPQDLYDACILGLDGEIDRLLGELRRRGALDNTIVAVTSDHGEYFGEHGLTGHGNGLHLPVLHVPLVIRYPARVAAGVRVAEAVSLQALPATILALAGARDERFGATLAMDPRAGGEESPGPRRVVSSLAHAADAASPSPLRRFSVSVLTDSVHWIGRHDGREQAFAYREDPLELRDRAGDPGLRALLDSLRQDAGGAGHP